MTCGLCGAEFTPKNNVPIFILGLVFCKPSHEKKYLELYDKWLQAAYSGTRYEKPGTVCE